MYPEVPPPPSAASSSSATASDAELAQEVAKLAVSELVIGESAGTPVTEPAAASGTPTPVIPVSSKAVTSPGRPGFGTAGKSCIVRANHFLAEVAEKDLYHYDVAITPESVSRRTNRFVIKELVNLHKESTLGGRRPAYDGMKSLYTAGALPFTAKDIVVKLPGVKKGNDSAGKEYKVTIRFVGNIDLHNLQQFLAGRQLAVPQDTIHALDVVLRESPSSNYVTVSRSFFSGELGAKGDLGDGVECWRGYYQSLRPTQMGLSLNIDVAATSFYKPIPVVDFVAEYLNLRNPKRPLSDTDRVKIKKALRGVRVEATHCKDKCIRYKITGISTAPLNQLRFPLEDQGTNMSVVQYFRERYSYTLQFVSWPCLQAGNDNRPIYLPMEVCRIIEGQRYTKKLNERQVNNILRATCKRPAEREQSILKMVEHNNYNQDQYANEFGIKIAKQLVSVNARILPPPRLKYHDSGKEKSCNPHLGQWNMINKKMVGGARVDRWTCLNFSSIRPDDAMGFCYDLANMCNAIGMVFVTRPMINIRFANPDGMDSAFEDLHNSLSGKDLQLLIIILPDRSGSYGRIKRICETEVGIVSQCCQPRKALERNKQYLENVALKINVKVGGRNTVLEDALYKRLPFITELPTIIFGADVTHPPPGEDSAPSIAAVVASMDWPEVTKYKALISSQEHRQEMIQDLYSVVHVPEKGTSSKGMIRELLVSFYKATGFKPKRIIFYRDGVSEGQFSQVLLYEMDAIRKACASIEEGYLPPVTFIVVQKRHHTRIFPHDHGRRDMTDKSGNILPGTVVDTKICHPVEFDFYLCSHAGIKGTSRPTHYHVLFDENRFTADGLQILTNSLCYTYARCTRSVSVVPPAYYAHLAAFRARYYVETDQSDGSSSGVGGRSRSRPGELRQLPSIKQNVQAVMFYC